MIVTLTRDGYVKRTPLETFRAQHRGGRGRSAAATRQDDVVMRSFIAHTHQWVLFFTSRGIAFREKVWQLPEGGAQGKGRSLRQVLALQEAEQVTAVLPLPQDESLWEGLHLVFATASGNVRRNKLSDFRNVRSSGLIAMKLDDGDSLIGVQTCREGDDVLLATRKGRAIRFQATDDVLRVFASRGSDGVRGIRLGKGDEVIALSVLRHVEATPAEREAAIRNAAQRRRTNGNGAEEAEAPPAAAEEAEDGTGTEEVAEITLTPERARELEEAEEIILAITDGGFGKRSLAYDYRLTGRGGQGLEAMLFSRRTGKEVVATFPVRPGDDVMLVTDTGRLIRLPADQVRLTRRRSLGVMLLRLNEGERVNSCFPVVDDQGEAGPDSGAAQTGALAATEPPVVAGPETDTDG
jgi:DNA gyrase subunit A